MIPLSTAFSSGFTLSRISRGYEIRLDNQSIGTLQRPGFWSAHYVGRTQQGEWIFRRSGFFNTGAAILDTASRQPVAIFRSPWGGQGELTFSDGQKFLIASRGCWHPVWSVMTQDGQPVLQLLAREKTVDVQNTALPEGRIALLALFALYRKQMAEDDATVAVAVAAS